MGAPLNTDLQRAAQRLADLETLAYDVDKMSRGCYTSEGVNKTIIRCLEGLPSLRRMVFDEAQRCVDEERDRARSSVANLLGCRP